MPLNKQFLTHRGELSPLCDSCKCPDCTNPIREKTISIRGINKTARLYVTGTHTSQVVWCGGYVGDENVDDIQQFKPLQ